MNLARSVGSLAVGLGVLALCGCGGIGPSSITHDRFDYTEAIARSWQQQMLANMVKLRYGDTPVFLDVASVINQYSIEAQVDARWTWVHPVASIGDSKTVGGTASYTDKPTITYTPLSGERFARSIMKPIPPPALLSMIQAGYPIDLVFRTCTNCINGIRNRYGGSARARPADPRFHPLLERLRRLQDSGAIDLRVQKTGEMEGVVLTLRAPGDAAIQEDSLAVRQALGLDPAGGEFRIVYGAIARDNKEIAILSRSMLEIMVDLASNIEVPAADVQDKRVNATMPPDMVAGAAVLPLIGIHSSPQKPPDSFVAIPYRNQWFWIDDRDLRSKSIFTFLMFVFSLTESEEKGGAPIVTIPAG